MSSSSSSVVSSSRSSGEEKNENPPLTGIHLGLQQLEERITTQIRVPPRIIDIVGCDITIDDIQTAKRELINQGVDLTMDVNKKQNLAAPWNGAITWWVTPLLHFCSTGNLLIIKLLFLIGGDCTKLCDNNWSPMYAAAQRGHLNICKWLFKYGGDAKYQINKETSSGGTPLSTSCKEIEGKACRWLLRNGGGQHLSRRALQYVDISNSNPLILWMRENIQLHDTFIVFLCGAATESNDDDSRKQKRKRYHEERSLQILDGHLGIMELIGKYVGFIRGKECRMLKEFNELIINHTMDENKSSSDDDNSDNEE